MKKASKIYIAGHKGMVGSAIWRALTAAGYTNLIGKTSKELDLRNQAQVYKFITEEQPEAIIDAAAKVGGILANSKNQYEFLLENMQIQNNLIQAAHTNNVNKFIFLGSSCIYPKLAAQPLKEDYLLTDSLEPTNEGYAIAKISGVKLCQFIRNQYQKDFVSLMPTNLYGPFDNFDLTASHVLPAMLRKFYEAKNNNNATVNLWGNGTPMREFLHVDDLAKAVLFTLEHKLPEHVYNVGTGTDVTIKQLATTIQKITGHTGTIDWDSSKPNGTPRKLLDVSKLNKLGWQASIELEEGIATTFKWFLENQENLKKKN
ncbi:GDP-L-fucose synthase [Lutibacter sp. A64]|uniref:GDP-L-fucose synthase family protein n=1 Tax=Lutibacter sp. A64 TaxID=2918526 RepID=UPI001F069DFC|nr:GDP-L-fucose synthase [Lutibacter sp. A64]UMB54355.1 GDP-L-fucose synthase [Lutibacter sp. A64]